MKKSCEYCGRQVANLKPHYKTKICNKIKSVKLVQSIFRAKLNNKSSPLFKKIDQYIPLEISQLICSFIGDNKVRLINKDLCKQHPTTKKLNVVYKDSYVKYEMKTEPHLYIGDFWERSKKIITDWDYKMYIQQAKGGNLIEKMKNINPSRRSIVYIDHTRLNF